MNMIEYIQNMKASLQIAYCIIFHFHSHNYGYIIPLKCKICGFKLLHRKNTTAKFIDNTETVEFQLFVLK